MGKVKPVVQKWVTSTVSHIQVCPILLDFLLLICSIQSATIQGPETA